MYKIQVTVRIRDNIIAPSLRILFFFFIPAGLDVMAELDEQQLWQFKAVRKGLVR
jgi:putative effector of murein hydrolase LrgA (UPF0299 family)